MSDTAPGSRVGAQLGRYQLTRLLGRGQMGDVYEAQDTVNQRVVALKLVSSALSRDPAFRERLAWEARTAGRLHDPHVVPIQDYGEVDGQLFLDMRLIDGTDLSKALQQLGTLTPARAVVIVRQVALALDAAHAVGVIHRDVKPENILITRDDFVYLVDFGIADAAADGVTQVGDAARTFKYSAPERFTDTPISHEVDVYSLACVLYECLTGAPPYHGDNAGALIAAHMMQPIPRPSEAHPGIPGGFDEVIARGMAKDPHLRYASAGELALAAHQALSWPEPTPEDETVEHTQAAAALAHQSAGPSYPVGAWPAVPSPPPAGQAWPGDFGGFPLPSTAHTRRKSKLPLAVAAVVAVVVLAAAAIWLLRPSHSTSTASNPTSVTSTTAAPSPPDTAAQARLLSLLPAGYPPGRCKPTALPKDALAKVSCGLNTDPDGPSSATFTVFPDTAGLHFAFNGTVHNTAVVDCPGRIQSPGPWHRNATPDTTSGMLLCGTQKADPIVGWTNDAECLLAVAHTEPQGPTLDRLYAWWTTHS